MQASDQVHFSQLMTGLAEYYTITISIALLEIYWNGLKLYELSDVRSAFDSHMRNPDKGMFMPKVANVIHMLMGSTSDQAATAWAKVDHAVRSVGCVPDVVFDDALIHLVIADMGGWINFCSKTDNDWPYVQRDFEMRYRGHTARGGTPNYPAVLLGTANSYNRQCGFKTQPPTVLGNIALAKLVFKGGSDQSRIPVTHAVSLLSPPMEPPLQLAMPQALR